MLGLRGLHAVILDAVVQLVDSKPGAGLSGGNGVEIGAVGVLVRKDGSSGLLQTPYLLPPLWPTGNVRNVYVQVFGSWACRRG